MVVGDAEDIVVGVSSNAESKLGPWASAIMEATASALTEVEGGSAVDELVAAVGVGVVITADVELILTSWAVNGLGDAEGGTATTELDEEPAAGEDETIDPSGVDWMSAAEGTEEDILTAVELDEAVGMSTEVLDSTSAAGLGGGTDGSVLVVDGTAND